MSKGPGPPRIVVLGGINMDHIGVTARLPAPGETVAGERFYTAPGGKGANQAVAAARLGAQVSMVGRVGEDEFGPSMLADLRSHGIEVAGIAVDPDNSSGIAMILLLALSNVGSRTAALSPITAKGIGFWSAMYIPIVVAMAARQNVAAALSGGWMAIIAGVAAVAASFALIPVLAHFGQGGQDDS